MSKSGGMIEFYAFISGSWIVDRGAGETQRRLVVSGEGRRQRNRQTLEPLANLITQAAGAGARARPIDRRDETRRAMTPHNPSTIAPAKRSYDCDDH